MKFLWSQFSTFWWFLWTKALPFCVSITPPHLTQSANLLTVPSASTYRPLPSCLCYVWKWISRRSFSAAEVTITIILFPGLSFFPLWKTGVSALSLFPVFMDFCRSPWFFTDDRQQVTLSVSNKSHQALWIWIHPVVVAPSSVLLPSWLSSITNSAGVNLCLIQKRHWGPCFVMLATMLFSHYLAGLHSLWTSSVVSVPVESLLVTVNGLYLTSAEPLLYSFLSKNAKIISLYSSFVHLFNSCMLFGCINGLPHA